jgi:hypothetical protein
MSRSDPLLSGGIRQSVWWGDFTSRPSFTLREPTNLPALVNDGVRIVSDR